MGERQGELLVDFTIFTVLTNTWSVVVCTLSSLGDPGSILGRTSTQDFKIIEKKELLYL